MDSDVAADATIERLLRDQGEDGWPASLQPFLADLRVATAGPPPAPSPALEALLDGANPPGKAPAAAAAAAAADGAVRRRGTRPSPPAVVPRGSGGRGAARRVAAAGLAAKAALALGLAGSAAAAGVFPDPVDDVVRRFVELVTPFDMPGDVLPGDVLPGDVLPGDVMPGDVSSPTGTPVPLTSTSGGAGLDSGTGDPGSPASADHANGVPAERSAHERARDGSHGRASAPGQQVDEPSSAKTATKPDPSTPGGGRQDQAGSKSPPGSPPGQGHAPGQQGSGPPPGQGHAPGQQGSGPPGHDDAPGQQRSGPPGHDHARADPGSAAGAPPPSAGRPD
jgi:hypothetical protein